MKRRLLLVFSCLLLVPAFCLNAAEPTEKWGELIFADDFERTESQELKDEPGNEWTTSSDKTAGGNKQVDLRDGYLHIYTHETANHATSVRHEFQFENGTLGLKFRLDNERDSLKLNFTDLGCKTVHAGHLFDAVVSPKGVLLEDRKTGVMDLKIRAARAEGKLTKSQQQMLASLKQFFPMPIETGVWHELLVHVDGDTLKATVDGHRVAEFSAPGFAHPTKTMIRLLVPYTASVDQLRIWRRQ